MNFRLTRDRVVLRETAANSGARRRKANPFFRFFFFLIFLAGKYNKTLTVITGPAGNSFSSTSGSRSVRAGSFPDSFPPYRFALRRSRAQKGIFLARKVRRPYIFACFAIIFTPSASKLKNPIWTD